MCSTDSFESPQGESQGIHGFTVPQTGEVQANGRGFVMFASGEPFTQPGQTAFDSCLYVLARGESQGGQGNEACSAIQVASVLAGVFGWWFSILLRAKASQCSIGNDWNGETGGPDLLPEIR